MRGVVLFTSSLTSHASHFMTEQAFDVGAVGDFAEDSITPRLAGEQEVVVVRQKGEFYALPDRCTHAKYPLHDGELLDGALKCTYHGAKFDLGTGRATLPAVKKIQLFGVEVREGRVYVTVREGVK